MQKKLIGFAFTGAVGTLLHFVYEYRRQSAHRGVLVPSTSPPGST